MLKKIIYSLMAMVMAAGEVAASIQPAEARRGGRVALGVGAAILGLGLLGAYANARERAYYRSGGCYPGPEECGWRNRRCFYNSYGDYVCRGGRYTCWRPTYCD